MIYTHAITDSLEFELTWSVKSPLAPLYQRGVIPPFVKEPVLSLSKERFGGICGECPDNYQTINKSMTIKEAKSPLDF
jgi:hypothetical protein